MGVLWWSCSITCCGCSRALSVCCGSCIRCARRAASIPAAMVWRTCFGQTAGCCEPSRAPVPAHVYGLVVCHGGRIVLGMASDGRVKWQGRPGQVSRAVGMHGPRCHACRHRGAVPLLPREAALWAVTKHAQLLPRTGLSWCGERWCVCACVCCGLVPHMHPLHNSPSEQRGAVHP